MDSQTPDCRISIARSLVLAGLLGAADGSPTALKGLFVNAFLRANGVPAPAATSAAAATVTLTCAPEK